ncbi:hypothetical protein [Candidatus Lokiarchaeum ossiferum]|uniref:hypothetical protein n=1 Tax=Candidatus Lokiarchaeum ossiferum TaxID=2951803 RepID=UPI00352CB9A4
MVDTSNVIRNGPKVTRPNMTNATSENQIDAYFDMANPEAKWRNIKIIVVGLMNLILIGIMFAYIEDEFWLVVAIIVAVITIFPAILLVFKKKSEYRFFTYCINVYGIVAAISIFSAIMILPIIITLVFMVDVISTDFALQPQGIASKNMETDERLD